MNLSAELATDDEERKKKLLAQANGMDSMASQMLFGSVGKGMILGY
jgi:hypothetical protein